jgi:hypothetical protein
MKYKILTLRFSDDEFRKLQNKKETEMILNKKVNKWEDFILKKCKIK